MAYSSGGLIQISDFTTRRDQVNTLYGVGSGTNGYGQTNTVPTTSISGTVVPASDWATMIARMSTMQQHQFNNTSGIPTQPTSGGIITYLSAVDTAISSLQTNKLTVYTQTASGALASTSNATSWVTASTKTWTITFGNGDQARYFFNTGGIIQVVSNANTMSPATWNSFANTGYNYTNFGATSFGYGGTVGTFTINTNLSTSGYYNLTTYPTTYFQISETGTGNANYNNNYIQVNYSCNGANVSGNGDRGNIITVTLIFNDNDANTFGRTVTGTTNAYIQLYYPETTYLTNPSSPWGTVSVANTVNTQG
jgi:hypothetical protein